MTMIIALATEHFALIVGDRLTIANSDGHFTLSSGEVRPFKAGDRSDVPKLYQSVDGRDVLAFAGEMRRAVEWATFAKELHGFDCDEALSRRMFSDVNRFSELPLAPDDLRESIDSCLHVWGDESRFVITKIEANFRIATRESWRSGPKAELLRVIGTGVEPFESVWPEVREAMRSLGKSSEPPEKYVSMFVNVFERISKMAPDVGPLRDALALEKGPAWRRITEY